jgi:amino acid adenylation domain-containing protein/non-ribosomal peptide synthase protein (TIGR01720 family)
VIELPGLKFSELESDTGASPFDLTLAMAVGEQGIDGAFEYNAELFRPETIQRLAGHFLVLLEAIAADPAKPISRLPLASPAEMRRCLVEWNATAVDFGLPACAHQLFEAQAARSPDAIALILPGEDGKPAGQCTYAELDRWSNRVARALRRFGAGPGKLVGLCVRRSLEMAAGLLGILKSGAAYVPLDPAYPPERLAFMIQDSGIEIAITQPGSGELPPAVVCIDAHGPEIGRETIAPLEGEVAPVDLAYVIYTSGSTGKPKGVMVAHRSLANHTLAMARLFALQPHDRVLQFSTINFDAALEEIFPAWSCGAGVVLRPGEALPSGQELIGLVEEYRLTVLDLPTAYWHEWVHEMTLSPQPLPASLRLLVLGGEKVLAERYAAWRQVVGEQGAVINTYGPTEGTIVATAYEFPAWEGAWESSDDIPIGRPIANDHAYVLDRNLEPVPVGVPGELFLGGDGVACGYYRRPELTAEKFIARPIVPSSPDPVVGPVSSSSGRRDDTTNDEETKDERLYRTGDRARWRPDGHLEFLGREDQQVKVRGFRVEPGEIEAVLIQHPQVREAVVVARQDAAGKRLAAYLVPAEAGLDPGELRGFLKARLPEYMIPAAFVTLPKLPLTPTGKVDRLAFPAPEFSRQEAAQAYQAPSTPDEKILAGIWAQVLGMEAEKIGVYDNFFELGGDSILSIQIVARARQAGLLLTPRQVFEAPTVAGLAAVAGRGVGAVQAEQGVLEGALPLTPIQRWFFEQELPEPGYWNQSVLFEVEGALDTALFEKAVGAIYRHHDSLRMRFRREAAGWEPTYEGTGALAPFEWIDLSDQPESAHPAEIEARAQALQQSLDLAAGPVMRAAYLSRGASLSGRLLIVIHHLVVDGVSWRILLEDLARAYGQLIEGREALLPPKTTSYREWAQKLEAHAQTPQLLEELPYWLSLASLEPGGFPVDFPGGLNQEASAATITGELSESDTDALLQEVPPVYHTGINDILLAALGLAHARWTGSPELLVDLEGHGREDLFEGVDLARTVGWFTSLYPVKLSVPGDDPGESVKEVKEQLRKVPGRGLGYGALRYLCGDPLVREQMRSIPQAEISFNYLGQFTQDMEADTTFRPAREAHGLDRNPLGRRENLLEANAAVSGGRLSVAWTYSRNLHRPETIARFSGLYLDALRDIIAHCLSPEAGSFTPSDFPLAGLDQKKLDKVLSKLKPPKGLSK